MHRRAGAAKVNAELRLASIFARLRTTKLHGLGELWARQDLTKAGRAQRRQATIIRTAAPIEAAACRTAAEAAGSFLREARDSRMPAQAL